MHPDVSSPRIDDFTSTRRRRAIRRLKEVPVLPSLVTLGNLWCGFLAMAKVADALGQVHPGAPFSSVVSLFASASLSLAKRLKTLTVSSSVVAWSLPATGASLQPMILTVTLAVLVAPCWSTML
jgi:hypothetical protein